MKTERYCSCNYIQSGINFYPSNIIKFCCFSLNDDVNICKIDENTNIDELINIINQKRKEVIEQQKKGIYLDSCKNCSCLKEADWIDDKKNILTNVTFNHYLKCNLKCEHCNYVKERDYVKDTDEELLLPIIEKFYSKNYINEKTIFDVGGGEPSISKGMDKIVEFALSKNIKIHINSNVAKFNELYIKGINQNNLFLTLTPDAGSREVYKKIKGADYFDIMKKNLQQYMQHASEKIEVKFIIEKNNVEDIDNMIKLCTDTGVKNVILSFDLNVKEEDYPKYKPYIRRFKDLCEENKLNVTPRLVPQVLLLDLEVYKYEKILKQIKSKIST